MNLLNGGIETKIFFYKFSHFNLVLFLFESYLIDERNNNWKRWDGFENFFVKMKISNINLVFVRIDVFYC